MIIFSRFGFPISCKYSRSGHSLNYSSQAHVLCSTLRCRCAVFYQPVSTAQRFKRVDYSPVWYRYGRSTRLGYHMVPNRSCELYLLNRILTPHIRSHVDTNVRLVFCIGTLWKIGCGIHEITTYKSGRGCSTGKGGTNTLHGEKKEQEEQIPAPI